VRTDYAGHDRAYRKRKAAGKPGWATAEQVADYLKLLEQEFQADCVPQQGNLLELGCGDGANAVWLTERGYEVYGVDIAPFAIEWAKEKAKACHVSIDFQVGNVLDLVNYADDAFDIVLDGHCFHCIIGDDRQRFLASALRVLKPHGVLHICTMCGDVTCEEFRQHFDSQSCCLIYQGDLAVRYIGHAEDILAEIRSAGFRILNWRIQSRQDADDQDDLLVMATKSSS
jgi:ubiquinone/menaquinone biosynthesis C-methylase UbiE